MIQHRPPRVLESLLRSVGAHATFREAMLGDLAEEYADHASRDGTLAARLWYVRQAVRSMPYLLASFALQPGNVRRVLRVVGVSYLVAAIPAVLTVLVAETVLQQFGWSTQSVQQAFVDMQPLVVMGVLFLQSLSPLCGGFIATRLDRRSPMVSVFALSVLWSGALLVATAFVPVPVPGWWRLATVAVVLAGTWISGLFGVWSTTSRAARIHR